MANNCHVEMRPTGFKGTIKRRCVNAKRSQSYDDVMFNMAGIPTSLKRISGGLNVPTDFSKINFKPPPWLDMDKFKSGQKFALKYYFGVSYSQMLSLMILFSFKKGLEPLVFTNKSSTPFSAFQRYLSTVVRVRSWYRGDVWDPSSEAGRNIAAVRTLHRSVKDRMKSTDPELFASRVKLNPEEIFCPFLSEILEDCRESVPVENDLPEVTTHFSQLEMSVTQFGFLGLFILYPYKFGASFVPEHELDSFVHFWAGLGYLLGIEDGYNFCIGGINECRQMSLDVINYWVKPSLREVGPEWEHMSRCAIEGTRYFIPLISFDVAVLYFFWVLDVPTPRLSAAVPWWNRILFRLQRFAATSLPEWAGALYTWAVNRCIDRALRAQASTLHQ